MDLLPLCAFIFVGIFSGLIAGMLGISGGLITVPCLIYLFRALDFPDGSIVHLAIGTSLASMVFNAFSATVAYHRRRVVDWKIVSRMLVGIAIGGCAGAVIARFIPGNTLEKIFGVFACLFSLYFFRGGRKLYKTSLSLSRGVLVSIGLLISFVASILGLGGGIFTVPLLMTFKIPAKRAIATSAATGMFITLIGALSYLYAGYVQTAQPHFMTVPYSAGYLYLPAFALISLSSFFCAPLGAKLACVLPEITLHKFFACALFVIGVLMMGDL